MYDTIPCDFLILAPLDSEINALVRELSKKQWEDKSKAKIVSNPEDLGKLYWFESPNHNATVVLIKLYRQGVLEACLETCSALRVFSPACVISFGICGALQNDMQPGHGIIADSVIYYEPSRLQPADGRSSIGPRPQPGDVDGLFHAFVDHANNTSCGPLASGEKLFADDKSPIRESILRVQQNTLAVDMEAAGVLKATKRFSAARFGAIKGVSDRANQQKGANSAEDEKARKKGATKAAELVAQFVSNQRVSRLEVGSSPETVKEVHDIVGTLRPYGIRVEPATLSRVLDGRIVKIPAYYHWTQYGADLNWIDFKVLCALASLPAEIFESVPLVSLRNGVTKHGRWKETVGKVLGSDVEVKFSEDSAEGGQREARVQESVRQALQAEDTRPSTLVPHLLKQYYGRLVVFSWSKVQKTWRHLEWAPQCRYSVFLWDTWQLDNAFEKSQPPVAEVCIDKDFGALDAWLASNANVQCLIDFVNHFRFCLGRDIEEVTDVPEAGERIERLKEKWNATYFQRQ